MKYSSSLATVSLAMLLACAPDIPVQAKRDYSAYPQHKGGIALYNIAKILENNCFDNIWNVNEEGLTCRVNRSLYWGMPRKIFDVQVRWSDIREAKPSLCQPNLDSGCVALIKKSDDIVYFPAWHEVERADFVEAVRVYLASGK